MNTNGNIYTVVYSTIIVVLVAAVLAFASSALKPMQDANIKAETISQMLDAAGIQSKDTPATNEQLLDIYAENIAEAFVIDGSGNKTGILSTDRSNIELEDGLKAQNTNIVKEANVSLPVYVFKNGTTVIPVYGAGLWGPVWGYIAFEEDLRTISGAYFDHGSETPGLGAKIKDDPAFRALFKGRKADFEASPVFAIVKGASAANEVDAITGATMTSKGLSAAIGTWLKAYAPYFTANSQPAKHKCNCGRFCPCGEACECDCHCHPGQTACECPGCACQNCPTGSHKMEE